MELGCRMMKMRRMQTDADGTAEEPVRSMVVPQEQRPKRVVSSHSPAFSLPFSPR